MTAVADLDTGLMDVTWSGGISGGGAQTSTGIAIDRRVTTTSSEPRPTPTPWTSARADFINVDFLTVDHVAVPEPASLALVALGGLTLLGRRRQG